MLKDCRGGGERCPGDQARVTGPFQVLLKNETSCSGVGWLAQDQHCSEWGGGSQAGEGSDETGLREIAQVRPVRSGCWKWEEDWSLGTIWEDVVQLSGLKV